MDKGKQAFVRNSKRRVVQPTCMNGKLILEKQKVASRSKDNESSSSDSEVEERQFRVFGKEKGECSRFKFMGNGPKLDGLLKENRQQEEGSHFSSGDGLNLTFGLMEEGIQPESSNESAHKKVENSQRRRAALTENIPKKLLVRSSKQRTISLSDNDGRLMSLPLKGPIQLPLKDGQGRQIRGKDFREVPLSVEFEGIEETQENVISNTILKPKSSRCYWSLEEEITKVIEKVVAIGQIVTSKSRKEGHVQQSSGKDHNWNLEEEVTKVIEVAVALGFDFNSSEDELGEQIARREREVDDR